MNDDQAQTLLPHFAFFPFLFPLSLFSNMTRPRQEGTEIGEMMTITKHASFFLPFLDYFILFFKANEDIDSSIPWRMTFWCQRLHSTQPNSLCVNQVLVFRIN